MNIESVREFCLSIKGASECMPFDDTVIVFKVMDKMFAYMSIEKREGNFEIAMKCEPERAVTLREHYSGIIPGYHSNKKYWNSVLLESDVSCELLEELILHSVDEVIKKLPKKKQEEYANLPKE